MPSSTIAGLLREAKHVVVFTGAGVSAESGIPTFRDALSGLWSRFDPAQLATAEAFRADPSLCWGWYESRRLKVLQAKPNAAHMAIAELAKHVPRLTVVTQNVDDLHERAGSLDVIHLHGSLHSPRCIDCGNPYEAAIPPGGVSDENCRLEPPRCGACNGHIRPGVVWFGEMLPEDAWSAGLGAAEECDWACPVTADAKKLATEPTALSLLRIRSVNGNPVLNAVDSCCKTHGCSWQLPGGPVSLWGRPRRLPLSSM